MSAKVCSEIVYSFQYKTVQGDLQVYFFIFILPFSNMANSIKFHNSLIVGAATKAQLFAGSKGVFC